MGKVRSCLLVSIVLVQLVRLFALRNRLRPFLLNSVRETTRRPILIAPAVARHTVSDVMQRIKASTIVKNNTSGTLRNLIKWGDQWSLEKDTDVTLKSSESCISNSQFERVSGCASIVQIQTSLVPMVNGSIDTGAFVQQERCVHVEGSADSRVTQGMLAILCKVFNKLTPNEAMSLSAQEMTSFFGFDQLLPPGRQNTFYNMITLIQSQLAKLLNSTDSDCEVQVNLETFREKHAQPCSAFLLKPDTESIQDLDNQASPVIQVDPRKEEVALLISGGVDSSVALKLLLDQGHKVRAYYLKIWLEDELAHMNACPWDEDIQYAQSVCDQLGVPMETVPLQKEYWRHVVQYTLDESRAGRTPNPDVMCNSMIKFGAFYEYVGRFHKKIASGHYAQIKLLSEVTPADRADPNMPPTSAAITPRDLAPLSSLSEGEVENKADKDVLPSHSADLSDPVTAVDPEEVALVLSADPAKDQAYFLCNLSQQQLRRCVFPIGHLPKVEVRALAKQHNLSTSERKDSQGICFLGKLKFGDFLEHYLGVNPGPLVDRATNSVVGHHRELWFHNIGQKAGLGFSLNEEVLGRGPWMVCEKDILSNTIYVSNDPALWAQQRRTHTISGIKWINGVPTTLRRHFGSTFPPDLQSPYIIKMKVRHSPKFVYARITNCTGKTDIPSTNSFPSVSDAMLGKASSQYEACRLDEVKVVLLGEETPFVSPGQFMAFFEGDVCLGSGTLS